MIVKPAEGLTVFDPVTMRPIGADGIPAADGDLHWARLARDGDVTIEPDPAPADAPVPAPSSEATDR